EARRGHLMAPPDSVYEMAILRRLADPQWEGRGVGTAGLDSAANFLAGEMRRLGLKPGGEEGGYFQPFDGTTGVEAGKPCAFGALVVNGPRYHAGEPLPGPVRDGSGYMTSGLLAGLIAPEAAEALLAPVGLTLAGLQSTIDDATKPHSVALPESATITVTLK